MIPVQTYFCYQLAQEIIFCIDSSGENITDCPLMEFHVHSTNTETALGSTEL